MHQSRLHQGEFVADGQLDDVILAVFYELGKAEVIATVNNEIAEFVGKAKGDGKVERLDFHTQIG